MSVFRRHKKSTPPSSREGRAARRHGSSRAAASRARTAGPADGGADAQEQFIIDALHDLHDTVVREVMTPRVDVVALSIPLTVDAVTQAVRESGHSCFPVYGDNLDDLIGVLFVNDLFRAGWKVSGADDGGGRRRGPPGRPGRRQPTRPPTAVTVRPAPGPIDISRRLRQPFLVPESRLVLDVLAEMRRQRRAFAVVVDEHGGVEGVLTVKDLLGALVGDLPDEFDPDDEPDVVRVDGSRWLVDGRMSVDDVRDRLDINLPEGEYVTLGGFLFDAFGHIPEEGESLDVDGWELRVSGDGQAPDRQGGGQAAGPAAPRRPSRRPTARGTSAPPSGSITVVRDRSSDRFRTTGCGAAWLARCVRDAEVPGSNPGSPTTETAGQSAGLASGSSMRLSNLPDLARHSARSGSVIVSLTRSPQRTEFPVESHS